MLHPQGCALSAPFWKCSCHFLSCRQLLSIDVWVAVCRWCVYLGCSGYGLGSIGSPVCKADQKLCCIKSQGQGDIGALEFQIVLSHVCTRINRTVFTYLACTSTMHFDTMFACQAPWWARRACACPTKSAFASTRLSSAFPLSPSLSAAGSGCTGPKNLGAAGFPTLRCLPLARPLAANTRQSIRARRTLWRQLPTRTSSVSFVRDMTVLIHSLCDIHSHMATRCWQPLIDDMSRSHPYRTWLIRVWHLFPVTRWRIWQPCWAGVPKRPWIREPDSRFVGRQAHLLEQSWHEAIPSRPYFVFP